MIEIEEPGFYRTLPLVPSSQAEEAARIISYYDEKDDYNLLTEHGIAKVIQMAIDNASL